MVEHLQTFTQIQTAGGFFIIKHSSEEQVQFLSPVISGFPLDLDLDLDRNLLSLLDGSLDLDLVLVLLST